MGELKFSGMITELSLYLEAELKLKGGKLHGTVVLISKSTVPAGN